MRGNALLNPCRRTTLRSTSQTRRRAAKLDTPQVGRGIHSMHHDLVGWSDIMRLAQSDRARPDWS